MRKEFEKIYSPEEIREMEKTRKRVDDLEKDRIDEWEKNPERMKEDYELGKIHDLGIAEKEERKKVTKEFEETLKAAGKNEDEINEILSIHKKNIHSQADRLTDEKLGKLEAESVALIDPLTGLGTRRALEEKLASMFLIPEKKGNNENADQVRRKRDSERRKGEDRRQIERRKKNGVIMVDIDFFKLVNDQHGHPVGDKVLREVAKRITNKLKEILREGDDLFIKEGSSYRFGGEEITVLLSDVDSDSISRVAERIRFAIDSEKFDIGSDNTIGVTVSLGCGMIPVMSEKVKKQDLIGIAVQEADIALYNAKKGGRNKVVVYADGMKGKEQK